MRKRIYLNNDWRFTESFDNKILNKDFDSNEMEKVRLPHTCVETPFNYFDEETYQMISGYRRIISAPESWEGKRIILTIDGAAHESEVFLNGKKIGEHHCGYTAFSIDLSEELVYGQDNILVIKVDSREDRNIPPFGFVIDYMTYGGIYREVYLEILNSTYIEDIFIQSNVELGETSHISELDKKGDLVKARQVEIKSEITLNNFQENTRVIQYIKKKDEGDYKVLGESILSDLNTKLSFNKEGIELWDIDNPVLYDIKTLILVNDQEIDNKITRVGFRKGVFKKDGFYLNNRKVKIRGLNRHQSYPYVGYAMPESMQKLDADILKYELGLNSVRTSHYPQSHHFIDRCDEIGLLVFTEFPGWQYIGDEEWKNQAVENVRDMVSQYRNHTSIILWGVRINESMDDDEFYKRTNQVARELDKTRPTGGVRNFKNSNLLEDVYTYNDFSHNGKTKGCEKKKNITSDMDKAYLVCEYNGHMFPTKTFDNEEHRTEHALRHANVLDSINEEEDIAGSFGWCMFDYNTHKDFGSGDRICHHGVMDMFRNPKLAADVYASQSEETDVLSISSSMDIGEHPESNRGQVYIITNADSVRMYRNDQFIKEYTKQDSPYKYLKHGPILIDDYVGNLIVDNENFTPGQAKDIKAALNAVSRYGLTNLPARIKLKLLKLLTINRMTYSQAVDLYNKYIGDWGGSSTVYVFEAIKDGQVVKTVKKKPMTSLSLSAQADHNELSEKDTYDVASIRIKAVDESDNTLSFFAEPIFLETEGPIEIIGPKVISLKGGMGGTYVKTRGEEGKALIKIKSLQTEDVLIEFTVNVDKQD